MSKPEDHLIRSAEWEIWYQDTFDLACPRQLELAGRGLINGLVKLWARHLYETIQPDGSDGFSRFNLWWKQGACSIAITGDNTGQLKLRSWVFGEGRSGDQSYMEAADQDLLAIIAEAHSRLILINQKSDELTNLALLLKNKDAFIRQLKNS